MNHNPVGLGLKFPFTVTEGKVDFSTPTKEEDVQTSHVFEVVSGYVEQLVRTAVREISHVPDFGNPAYNFLFTPVNSDFLSALSYGVKSAITTYIPMVSIYSLAVTQRSTGKFNVHMVLSLIGSPTREDLNVEV